MKYIALSLAVGCTVLGACSKSSSTKPGSTSPSSAGGGGGASSTLTLPAITPVVQAATPKGLRGSTSLALDNNGDLALLDSNSISASDIASRFFSAGPTDVFRILTDIDSYVAGINEAAPACLVGGASAAVTPVAYSVDAVGSSQTFYGQCYSVGTATASDPQLRVVGMNAAKTTLYLYSAYGAERVAATVSTADGTEITAATSSTPLAINATLGVGYTSPTWSNGSYGVVQLYAEASAADLTSGVSSGTGSGTTATGGASGTSAGFGFEMSVAGIGMGYCGAQLTSDGTDVYIEGSIDMGTTCDAASTLCVAASDLTAVTGTCSVAAFGTNTIAIGREGGTGAGGQVFGVAGYPATPNIVLSGTATDALRFGPTTPPTGTVNMMSSSSSGTGGSGTSSATSSASGT